MADPGAPPDSGSPPDPGGQSAAGERHLRASDVDRQAVADRLRSALDEGRLDFHEYDSRLRDAYTAKTYGELERLLADLPDVAPADRSALTPRGQDAVAAAQRSIAAYPDATRRWLIALWDDYFGAVAICVTIWAIIAVSSGEMAGLWPLWVAGPWGAFLAYQTVRGLAAGEPQRWAAKQDRKRAAKLKKRAQRQGEIEGGEEPGASQA